MRTLLALLLTFFLIACDGAEHVSAGEFMTQFGWVNKPQSVKAVSYLGQKDGKAFIQVRSMSSATQKWSDKVIYVELSELDASSQKALSLSDVKPKS